MKTLAKILGPTLVVLLAAFVVSGQDIRRATATIGTNLLFATDGVYSIGGAAANRPSTINATSNITSGAAFTTNGTANTTASEYRFTTSVIQGTATGVLTFMNNGRTDFTRFNLGGATTGFNALSTSAAGGVPQGIIIQRADGTPQVFANLGAATDGSQIYCSDCTFANPCAGAGTGAYAKRLAGAWRCD